MMLVCSPLRWSRDERIEGLDTRHGAKLFDIDLDCMHDVGVCFLLFIDLGDSSAFGPLFAYINVGMEQRKIALYIVPLLISYGTTSMDIYSINKAINATFITKSTLTLELEKLDVRNYHVVSMVILYIGV